MPIFDQSEAEKLSQIHRYTDTQTHKHRINILSGHALRAAPAISVMLPQYTDEEAYFRYCFYRGISVYNRKLRKEM